jgi:hypothetical protein
LKEQERALLQFADMLTNAEIPADFDMEKFPRPERVELSSEGKINSVLLWVVAFMRFPDIKGITDVAGNSKESSQFYADQLITFCEACPDIDVKNDDVYKKLKVRQNVCLVRQKSRQK